MHQQANMIHFHMQGLGLYRLFLFQPNWCYPFDTRLISQDLPFQTKSSFLHGLNTADITPLLARDTYHQAKKGSTPTYCLQCILLFLETSQVNTLQIFCFCENERSKWSGLECQCYKVCLRENYVMMPWILSSVDIWKEESFSIFITLSINVSPWFIHQEILTRQIQ